MNATACIRGVEPRKVEVRVMGSDEFVDEALDSVDPAVKARFEQRSKALAAIGLERRATYEDVVGEYVDRVGALYDPEADRVTLFDRGAGASVESLVHEFAHALQHDLLDEGEGGQQSDAVTLDAALARGAMFEGDVTLTTDRAAMLMSGFDPNGPNWDRVYGDWAASTRQAYKDELLGVSLADRYFLYAFGAYFLEPVRRQRGQMGVDGWVRNPPRSTRAVTAGVERARRIDRVLRESYDPEEWQSELDASAATTADTSVASLADAAGLVFDAGERTVEAGSLDTDASAQLRPFTNGTPLLAPVLPGFELLTLDSLGAFVFERFARRQVFVAAESPESVRRIIDSASGLEADHLSLWYHPETENAVAVYRLRFSDRLVRAAWTRRVPNLEAEGELRSAIVDEDVVLVASADTRWLSALDLGALPWRAFDTASVPHGLRAGPAVAASQRLQPHGVRPSRSE
jgi:hypothetical protein